MIYHSTIQYNALERSLIGGKAYNLLKLSHLGLPIPAFAVIDTTSLDQSDPSKSEAVRTYVDSLSSFRRYAVRSSAANEDGALYSFAGQYKSFLNVKKEDVYNLIYEVAASNQSEHNLAYTANFNTNKSPVAVIVQEMIQSDVSGVGFAFHPVSNDRSTKVVNAIYGLGEGLVSGKYNADEYAIKDGAIQAKIAHKPRQLLALYDVNSSAFETDVALRLQTMPAMTDSQINQVCVLIDNCSSFFCQPQDIEFAFRAGKLYLLQSRPITTAKEAAIAQVNKIVWDNSNIIESYPGVTTPLTFSFISRSYEMAYKNMASYLGLPQKQLSKYDHVFKNTLGLIHGRVYYNLKSWYHMLAMLPGYSINARFMEAMMGVKERFDVSPDMVASKWEAFFSLPKTMVSLLKRFSFLKKERQNFFKLVHHTVEEYKLIDYSKFDVCEVIDLYLAFEKRLLDEWKAPLVNDLFAMFWFGLFKNEVTKLNLVNRPNLHNDLLCGSSDIVSTKPIHRTYAIAQHIKLNPIFFNLFLEEDDDFIYFLIQDDQKYCDLKILISDYLSEFGDRCVGELKLETKSYAHQPSGFIRLIKSYLKIDTNIDKEGDVLIRQEAEYHLNQKLKGKPLRKWWIMYLLATTRCLVSNRENLRYERTRAFGIVRTMFRHIGGKFQTLGVISHADDIFYLTREEIIAFKEGRAVTQNLRALINIRKQEFNDHNLLTHQAERPQSHGLVYHHYNTFEAKQPITSDVDHLTGIGCSPGIVNAIVQVVNAPDEITSLDGKILVTHSTDPGWVVLFPSAAAIVVERGSLLSHSAIVSREMGKPCIVGVTGLLQSLHTGDRIEIDGSAGTIKILHRALEEKIISHL